MTNFQTGTLVGLRIIIGWHFLYEGLAKLANPYWTSAGYLAESQWIFADLFIRVAASPAAVTAVDYINMWGLTLIGLALLLGLFARTATIAAIALLALYYISAPPFPGLSYPMPAEGSYLIVNKVLIEMGALLVLLAFPTARTWGLDRFLDRFRARRKAPATAELPVAAPEPREPVHA
ncbi:MAG TPA: DoxX family membrane protein [Longimicrobiales bacterium]|nr:DoxX family membrane protein [Longimicrobiales bacterium]